MVDREAKGLVEALRLQKLRAVNYLLDHIRDNPNKDIAVAIEFVEDVYVRTSEDEVFEQNKNYDENSKFTLNSSEVLKSFCSFLDIWFYNEYNSKISFCFVSTNSIGKESKTSRVKKLNIKLPEEQILSELATGDEKKIEKLAEIVKEIISDYYFENYPEETQNIELIKKLTVDDWCGFLKQINWSFGYCKVEELDLTITEKINECTYYSAYQNKGQEEAIKAKLLELVEGKSIKKDKFFQLVQKPDVELQFVNAVYGDKSLPDDAVYVLWETIDKQSDYRNLRDKILSVSPEFSQDRLSQLDRQAAMAKVAENSFKNNTKYLALKYRVFVFCYDKLFDLTLRKTKTTFTEEEIDNIIRQINTECVSEFEDLKKEYSYGVERNSVVLELFIEFIDSCYLAFD